MKLNIIESLTIKEDKKACDFTEKIIKESQNDNKWYQYFDDVYSLLNHPKSLVRNRAITILAANAKWDIDNKFDSIIDEFLLHIVDDKPITSRQCIKSLLEILQAKPHYSKKILKALRNADTSKYKDSMRPLIENDISVSIEYLTKKQSNI